MKALVYTAPHRIELREEPHPQPRPGESLLAVQAVGICGSDMHAYHGHDSRRPAPLILGHEAAGIICSGPRAGQRVAVNPLVVDPACPYAVEGRWNLSPTRQILSMPPRPGAFAEYAAVPDRNLLPIPDHMDMRSAALSEPVAVSWHAVKRGMACLPMPLPEARVGILGGGAIGLAAALIARHFGARSVAVGEVNPLRRESVRRSGLDVFDPAADDAPQDNTLDLVIDAVGADATRAAAGRCVRPGGVIVHVGLLPQFGGLDIRKVTLQEIIVTGSYCYTPMDFAAAVGALASGSLGALDWVEALPLEAGPQAFVDIDEGRISAAKIVLENRP